MYSLFMCLTRSNLKAYQSSVSKTKKLAISRVKYCRNRNNYLPLYDKNVVNELYCLTTSKQAKFIFCFCQTKLVNKLKKKETEIRMTIIFEARNIQKPLCHLLVYQRTECNK